MFTKQEKGIIIDSIFNYIEDSHKMFKYNQELFKH